MKRIYLILTLFGASVIPPSALAATFNYTGSVQQFTAPTTGEYHIVAYGAQGGSSTCTNCGAFNGSATYTGGLGAEMGGDFNLTAGETIDIYVGGMGLASFPGFLGDAPGGGGGGGSFVVVDSSTAPLAVAGGGGGGDGTFTANGGAGQTFVVNGGGGGSSGCEGGGGGGGFTGPGTDGTCGGGSGGGGFSGLQGGNGSSSGGNGGYGGGGGGSVLGGGGGGGYGGGNGDNDGGGSFLDSSVINALEVSGENSGNGMVTISPVVAAVPEPGSLSLLALTLLAIPGFRKLGRRS